MGVKSAVHNDYRDGLTGATYMFSGLNNMIDPYNLPIDKGQLPKAENVDINNTNSISRRSGYLNKISTTSAHSGWSNGSTALYVDGGYLKSFNGTSSTTIDIVTPNKKMYYVDANDVIVYSNGIESGFIGGSFTQTTTYSKDFKEPTKLGILLCFYNGRIYHAKENTLFCTDSFDIEHADVRQQKVATFADAITMIRRVNSGLFVGTEKQVIFLKGTDAVSGGFDLIIKANYGVVLGSDSAITTEYLSEGQGVGEAVIFTTTEGVCIGTDSGSFKNHSIATLSIPSSYSSASMIRDINGFKQYIVSLNTQLPIKNPYNDTAIDLIILS